MTQPTREQALATLADGQARMASLFGQLSDEQFARRGTIGGGEWSAKDLLGHIAFWEELALETIAAWRRGEKPRIEETFTGGGVDALNAWNEERKASWSAKEVRSEAKETHSRLVAEIEAMSDQEWQSKAPYQTERRSRLVTELGSVLGAPKRPFGHAFAHLADLEANVTSARGENP
jgi:hypothetical protein